MTRATSPICIWKKGANCGPARRNAPKQRLRKRPILGASSFSPLASPVRVVKLWGKSSGPCGRDRGPARRIAR